MEEKVYRLNKWGNKITKRMENGIPVYAIHAAETDAVLCEISFTGKKGDNGCVTNGDLLEIVRDRLHHFNETRYANHNTRCAEDRICEAILWSERASMRRAAFVEDGEKKESEA